MPHRGRHLARAGPRTGVAEPARRQRKSPALPCRGPALLTRPRRRILDRWPPEDATLAAYPRGAPRPEESHVDPPRRRWPPRGPRRRLPSGTPHEPGWGTGAGVSGAADLVAPGRQRRDPRAAVAGSAMAAAPSAPGRRNSPHPIASPAQARQLRPWPSNVDRPYATPFAGGGPPFHPRFADLERQDGQKLGPGRA